MNIISCFDKLFQIVSQVINSNKSIETSLAGSGESRVVSSDTNNVLAC